MSGPSAIRPGSYLKLWRNPTQGQIFIMIQMSPLNRGSLKDNCLSGLKGQFLLSYPCKCSICFPFHTQTNVGLDWINLCRVVYGKGPSKPSEPIEVYLPSSGFQKLLTLCPHCHCCSPATWGGHEPWDQPSSEPPRHPLSGWVRRSWISVK